MPRPSQAPPKAACKFWSIANCQTAMHRSRAYMRYKTHWRVTDGTAPGGKRRRCFLTYPEVRNRIKTDRERRSRVEAHSISGEQGRRPLTDGTRGNGGEHNRPRGRGCIHLMLSQ